MEATTKKEKFILILSSPITGDVFKRGVYSSKKRAQSAARRADLAYGAHLSRKCWNEETKEQVLLF